MNHEVQILLKNANAHIQKKEYGQAKDLLLRARLRDPSDPNPLRFMAVVAAMELQFDDALELINLAIKLDPEYGVAYSNRGNILKELGRHEEALLAFDKAIDLVPNYAEAYNNKGNALQALERYREALVWYDKALVLNPIYAQAYNNKGNACRQLGLYNEAMECYSKATEINPQYAESFWNQAMLQLSSGDFELGWKNYEARWFIEYPVTLLYTQIPRLENIEGISGKKILVWAEQGLGDTLQFCRYISELSSKGALVTFVVQPVLLEVLSPLRSYCDLIANLSRDTDRYFDYQSPLLSLPLLFNTSLDNVPAKIPYLSVDSKKRESFVSTLMISNHLKVGVVWNGGYRVDHPELWLTNKRRNINLEEIAALRDIPGVDFYSLQKGEPAESEFKLKKDELWPDAINLAPLLGDFSDTAALMDCLDLIISVDTSCAHLAGALGKPVWILNRYDSCWRWLRGSEDSPWYPTAKIYQQKQPNDWCEVISRVRTDLESLVKEKRLISF